MIKHWIYRHRAQIIRQIINWLPAIGAVSFWLLDVGIIILLRVVAYASDCPPGGFGDCENAAVTARNPVTPVLGSVTGVVLRGLLGGGVLGAPVFGPPGDSRPPVELPQEIPIAYGPGSNPPGALMPDGHIVLSPQSDPDRLTDYPDFIPWAKQVIEQSGLRGSAIPPNLAALLGAFPGLAAQVASGANYPPDNHIVQSGNDANTYLGTVYPGRIHLAPGPNGQPNYPWVEAPRGNEGLPKALAGAAFQPVEIVDPLNPSGPRIKVFDPNNTAIVRDWVPPNTAQTQTTIPPTSNANALAAQLNGLVTNPAAPGFNLTPQLDATGRPVVVVPENIPPGVPSIAYGTKEAVVNGQTVRVFDPAQPIIARHF